MKNMKKRILSFVIAMCFLIGLLPTNISFAASGIELSDMLTGIENGTPGGTGWRLETTNSPAMIINGKVDTIGNINGNTFQVDTTGLQNIFSDNNSATIGTEYSTKLTAEAGYSLPDSITVTIGGVTASSADYTYDKNTGNLTIQSDKVTGDIAITATGVLDSYDLYVGGVQVTAANKDNIRDAVNNATTNAASGTATYNPTTNTLTLNNFQLSDAGHNFDTNVGASIGAIYYNGSTGLNLILQGTNNITAPDSSKSSVGIYSLRELVLSGSGSMTITGGTSSGNISIGIEADDVKISGGSIIAIGGQAYNYSYGICSNNNIEITGGNLTAIGGQAESHSFGIYAAGIEVTDGSVEAKGGTSNNDYSFGICAGIVTVKDGSLSSTGGTASLKMSYGIEADEVNLIDGSIIAVGGDAKDESIGIVANDIEITDGSVKAIGSTSNGGYSCGINSSDVVVSGGVVEAKGGVANGGYSCGIDSNNVGLFGGVTVAQGNDESFVLDPTVDSSFTDAKVWHGDDEASAKINDIGVGIPTTAFNESYANFKYIRIAAATTSAPAPAITTSSLSNGKVGMAYNQTLMASGESLTWSCTGNMPVGLILNSNGTISGIPTSAGTFTFTVKVENSSGSDTKEFTITIDRGDTYTIRVNASPTEGGRVKVSHTSASSGTVVDLEALAKDGYNFVKWEIVSGGVTLADSTAPVTTFIMGNEAVSIKAVFEPIEQISRIDLEELTEIPDSLKGIFATLDELKAIMLSRILTQGGYTKDNTVFYDIKLQISEDGGKTWVDSTEDDFTRGGITVILPYPKGTNGNTHDFAVAHMFTDTSIKLGTTAGDVETPVVKELSEGLEITFNGLSPVSISWKESNSGEATLSDSETTSPKTGDMGAVNVLQCFAHKIR